MTNRCLALLALIVLPGISARLPAPRKTLSLRGGGVPTTGPVTVAVSAIQDAASGRGFFLCKDQCHFFLPFTGRGRKVLLAGLWAGALQFLLGLPCLLILPMWWCVPAMIRFSLVHAAAADQDVSTADAPSRSTDLARGHEGYLISAWVASIVGLMAVELAENALLLLVGMLLAAVLPGTKDDIPPVTSLLMASVMLPVKLYTALIQFTTPVCLEFAVYSQLAGTRRSS